MDNRYYDKVIGEMSVFLEENGFKAEGDAFVSAQKAIKVEYDETKQIYSLLLADVSEGGVGDYSAVGAYLFDESQTEKDAASVGIDFVDTLRSKLGIKAARKSIGTGIDLPTVQKGDAVNVTALTTKLLAIYPALKDTYKQEVSDKGKYLYLDFLTTYTVPEIRKTLESGNKKAVKKLVDTLTDIFIKGDNATSTIVVALFVSAIGKDEARFKAAAEHMEGCKNLIASINNQISLLGKNKKFTKAIKYVD